MNGSAKIISGGTGREGESEWSQPLRSQSLQLDPPEHQHREAKQSKRRSAGHVSASPCRMEDKSSGRPGSQPRMWHEDASPHTPLTLCSRTSSGTDSTLEMTPANSATSECSLEQLQASQKTETDSKKKKKKKKDKKKKEKKKVKKEKSKNSDDGEMPLTVRDEKLVEELCSFLTNTLSSNRNRESFLRMLREENGSVTSTALSTIVAEQASKAESLAIAPAYSTLSSPAPSVCTSLASHKNTLSQLYNKSTSGGWTNVDPPSVAASASLSRVSDSQTESHQSLASQGSSHRRSLQDPTSPANSSLTEKKSNVRGLSTSNHTNLSGMDSSEGSLSNSLSNSKNGSTQSGSENRVSVSEESSPEELFLALPPAFRSYLLGLHAEEMQLERKQQQTSNVLVDEDMLLMDGLVDIPENQYEMDDDHHHRAIELDIPHVATDSQSVVSDLSGLTGMISTIQRPVYRPPLEFVGHIRKVPLDVEETDNDSSDSDSEDEEDYYDDGHDDDKANNCMGSVCSHYGPVPSRSSIITDLKAAKALRDQIKKVTFEFAHVREYDTVLDNNPGCTDGPAIALGWYMVSETTYYVNEYGSKHCRYNDELILSRHTREGILLKMGYSPTDINAMVRRINKARRERKRTAQSVIGQNIEYAMQRVGRRFKFLVRGGSKRKLTGSCT